MTERAPNALPTGRSHVSYSEVSEWARCSWRHKLHHVERKGVQEHSPYFVFGGALHAACEGYVKTRSMDAEKAVAAIESGWKKHADLAQFRAWPVASAVADARALLADVPSFLDREFPGWECIDAEGRLYEPVEGNPGVFFKGFVDCVISAPAKSGATVFWVLDWKTSNRGWFADKRRDPILTAQVVLYRSYLAPKLGFDEYEARCGFIIMNRNTKRCELFRVSAGEVTVKRALKMVSNAVASIRRGIALKNKGDECKWCEFKGTAECP